MWTVFLKLGGSLITDKRQPETARHDVLVRLASEIAEARRLNPELRLVLGHGSGSYGHIYGQRYGTRNGVSSPEQWYGFAATADAAARLNRLVVGALLDAGIPVWGIQPGATLCCREGKIVSGSFDRAATALEMGLVPVVYGDVVLDTVQGGTIASTEEIFEWMLPRFRPQRLVLAGEVDGVYTSDPQVDPAAVRIDELTPATAREVEAGLGRSHGMDVTGGMGAKVTQALRMVGKVPGLEVIVCGGLTPGTVQAVLSDPDSVCGSRIVGQGS